MDDVVTRLVRFIDADDVLWDAVHEIERLREELEASQMTITALHKLIGERQ